MKSGIKAYIKSAEFRKLAAAVVVSAVVLSMAACGKKEDTAAPQPETAQTETVKTEAVKTEDTQAETKEMVGMPNPMVEITDSSEFEKQLGIRIDASKLHTQPKMFIIDGRMADVVMELTNVENQPVEYRLRATKDAASAPMMHGIYDELKEIGTVDMDFGDKKVSILQKETKDGKTTVHTWQIGDVYYSLVINNQHSQMQYAEVMDSIFLAIGLDPSAKDN